jgi:predicted HAD superfamily Cof-like phosphohydrolase
MQHPDYFQNIKDFHEKFDLMYTGSPRELTLREAEFRFQFICEELNEYGTAVTKRDLESQLDALVDLVYVAMGTAYMHGFPFDEAWRRVHAANMKKVRVTQVEQSTRGSTLDVVKPPGWEKPSLLDLVRAM